MGHIQIKKHMKCQKFIEIFHCCITRIRNKKHDFFESYLFITTTLRKENMGQLNFKKPFEFHSFSDIFYCGMNKVRKTILDVFMQSPYTRIIFLKNMGQSLFNKYSKFQNFDEIYCRMIRFRNVKLSVFWQYQNTKSILRRKI